MTTKAKPTVHLNGTSAEELSNQWLEVLSAALRLEKALQDAQPHDRDYYVQDEQGLGLVARNENRARLSAVAEIERDAREMRAHILGQVRKKELAERFGKEQL